MEAAPPRPHTVPPRSGFQSESVLKILQEIENEARGPLAKPKPPQKNHLQENVRRLKEMEAKQKLSQKQPLKATQGTSITFVSPSLQKSLPRLPKTACAFKTQPGNRPPLHPSRSLPQLSQAFEASSSRGSIGSESGSDPRSKHKTKSEVGHRPGQIPNYLLERRKQWEEEKEERRREEEDVAPEGYTLLPDEERIETLELLKKNRGELVQSLSSLPVRNDTLRLRRCREDLEKQLAKVEEGLKIFSRPKVLIKHDI